MPDEQKYAYWEKRDNVAWLYLDDPKARNALGSGVILDAVQCLEEIARDDDVGVVCLTGAGDVAFCSGNNLRELSGMVERKAHVSLLHNAVRHNEKPVIAVVQGYCLGGGISLLANCDLGIASDRAEFGLPEVVRGYPPGRALGEILQTIPQKYAFDLAMTGRNWPAEKALMAGLITRVVPHDELFEEAQKWASDMAAFPPASLRATKVIMHRILNILPHDLRIEMNTIGFGTVGREGIQGDHANSIKSFFRHEEDTKARPLE